MPTHYHAVLWLDHLEARVIHFNAAAAEEQHVHAALPTHHLHTKAGSLSGTHVSEEPHFFADIVKALGDAQEILVAGPSTAKTEFIKYLHHRAPALVDRVVGIETLATLSDPQLVAEARRFFAAADRMRPQRG